MGRPKFCVYYADNLCLHAFMGSWYTVKLRLHTCIMVFKMPRVWVLQMLLFVLQAGTLPRPFGVCNALLKRGPQDLQCSSSYSVYDLTC